MNTDLQFNAVLAKNDLARNINSMVRSDCLSGGNENMNLETIKKYFKKYCSGSLHLIKKYADAEPPEDKLKILLEIEEMTLKLNQPSVLNIILCHRSDI